MWTKTKTFTVLWIFVVMAFVIGVNVWVRRKRALLLAGTSSAIADAAKKVGASQPFQLAAGSEAFQLAVTRAQSNDEVIKELGAPITADAAATKGSISTFGISGKADLIVPLSGAKKKGTLYASALKQDGEWKFYTLAVKTDERFIKLPK